MTKERLETLRKEFELALPILIGIIIGERSSEYDDDLLHISTCKLIMEKVKEAEMPLDGDVLATDEVYYLADEIAEKIIKELTK